MILDTYECVKFLNLIHYNAMEKCLSIFREDIFSNEKRHKIVSKFIAVLNSDLPKTQLSRFTKKQITEIAERIIQSLTVVMEFMDKGIKGLLTGDLTIYMLQKIESTLEKFSNKLVIVSSELESLLKKREEALKLFKLMQDYQSLGSSHSGQNLKGSKTMNKNVYLPSIGIDIPMTSNDLNSIMQGDDSDTKSNLLSNHMQVQKQLKEEIDKKKDESNLVINEIYNEITETAFSLDKYRVPYYGIKNPELENPINLFQRQLKIEELSFELSHAKYKNTLESLIKMGRADQLAASHRIVLHWLKSIENAVHEQQRIYLRKSNLEADKGKPSFFILQMPSEKIASICVMHLMKTLFKQFIRDLSDPEKPESSIIDFSTDFSNDSVKTPAVALFSELGILFDKELKNHISSNKRKGGITDKIEKHLMIEDSQLGSIPRHIQLKIGAFLTNIMCKNLTYTIGKKKHLLLKAQVLHESREKEIGYIIFNKSFIDYFVSEIDKVHDLNIHIERSLPMIYKPAPWKNHVLGAYYLKQTKIAKIIPNFREAHHLLSKTDISQICNALNIISDIKWRVNKDVLEMIEYIWAIGGGLGEIPKRFNERPITAELLRKARFKDKLKLIKEHQKNMETHALRCEFLLRLNIARSFKNVN